MKKRAFWMLGLAFVLAGTSVFLARNWLNEQTKPVVVQKSPEIRISKIVVAASPLGFGDTIRSEHLRLVDWPADAVIPGSFRSVEDLVGEEERVALRPIEVNEPILKKKVSGFGGRASLSAVLSPDMRAATIRVNDVNGVAGFVLPGDRVDVLLTRDLSGGEGNAALSMATDILLQNVKVLGVDQVADESQENPLVAKAVTLEVTPPQSQKLALAQQLGTLTLALRNVKDAEAEGVKTVGVRDLRVGEVNDAAKGGKAKSKSQEVAVKLTPKVKKDPFSSVRIVRGTAATQYEVQQERREVYSTGSSSEPLRLLPNAGAKGKEAAETSESNLQDGSDGLERQKNLSEQPISLLKENQNLVLADE